MSPSRKSKKFALELKQKRRYCNDGQLKTDSNGFVMGLSDKQRAYRAGYLSARRDLSNCRKRFKNKNGNGDIKLLM